jgi:phosphatidylserine/phosphatidylglycerophosphate/cardiolipin synthase-like enzyme
MPVIFDKEHYQQIVENGILQANAFVWIATANIKDLHVVRGKKAHSMLSDLSDLAEKGIVIRMLYSSEPSERFKKSFDLFDNLVAGGIEMQPCVRLHCKIIIIDGKRAYAGSANLTGAGLGAKSVRKRNFEAGYVTEDSKEIEAIMDYYDKIWIGSYCKTCGHRKECEDPIK